MTIAHRAVRGSAIILASSYANLAIGFATTIVLTRLLSPEIFGLFNLSLVFFMVIDFRNKLGLDYAFVHRQPTTDQLAATHWLLQVLLALSSLLVGFALALLLPTLGYDAHISRLLVGLCMIGVVEALGSTARVMLEKELRFGRSTIIISSALLLANLSAIA
jgi:PST family polysaccharide transporter